LFCAVDKYKMADMPDLSHLTPEERAIIEGVMMRQKQEEDRENEIMRLVKIKTILELEEPKYILLMNLNEQLIFTIFLDKKLVQKY
jgi:hypothetical protein